MFCYRCSNCNTTQQVATEQRMFSRLPPPATIWRRTSAAGRMLVIMPRPCPAKPGLISWRPSRRAASMTLCATMPCSGMGSGVAPEASNSCTQRFLIMRAGLPVRLLLTTVLSSLLSRIALFLRRGNVCFSGGEKRCATPYPRCSRTRAATKPRPSVMAQHRVRGAVAGVHYLWNQGHGANTAVVPASVVPLGDNEIEFARQHLPGVTRGPTTAPTFMPSW